VTPTATTDLLARLRAAVDPLDERVSAAPPLDPTGALPAAVLLLADPGAAGLPLLFIRRTHTMPSHPGQIAFPGGGAHRGDGGPAGTALREAHEELGIDPATVEVIGRLPAVPTASSGRLLDPVVGLQNGPLQPVPDPFEVAAWFWVPLTDLLAAPLTTRPIPAPAVRRELHFIEVAGHVIWGATAAILVDLFARLR